MSNVQSSTTGRKCATVDQFCAEHGISRPMFYKILKDGRGPRVMKVGSRTLVSEEAAAKWRQTMEAA